MQPDTSTTYLKQGQQLQRQGRLTEAEVAYRQAIELNPIFYGSFRYLGEVLALEGKLDQAVEAYQRAKELNPKALWVHQRLGEVFLQLNKLEDAIACFQTALEINPYFSWAYNGLGECWSLKGEEKEAIAAYQKAVALNPNTDKFRHNSEQALALQNSSPTQEQLSSEVIESQPHSNPSSDGQVTEKDRPETLPQTFEDCLELGKQLIAQGNLEAAVVAFRQTVKLKPENDEGYYFLGDALTKINQFEEAIVIFRKAIELNPYFYEAHQSLGETLVRQGNINEARKIYHNLSIHLSESGKIREAIDTFYKAPSGQPTKGAAYSYIWKGLNQLGVFNETSPYCQVEVLQQEATEYFRQNSQQYKIIDMNNLTPENRQFLESESFSIPHLELIREDNLALEEIYINSITTEEKLSLAKKVKKHTRKNDPLYELHCSNDFQQTIIETGYIYLTDPISGKVLRSNHSFFFYHQGWMPIYFYRFSGNQVFYLAVSDFFSCKKFLYFPYSETIIAYWLAFNSPIEAVNELKGYFIRYWKQVKDYILNHQRKNIANIVGSINQIAHYFWQDITGIDYLYENEILSKVDKFLVNFDFLSIHNIFPEIPQQNIIRFTQEDIFNSILTNQLFVVRVTDNLIKDSLCNRIYTGCLNRAFPGVLEQIESAARKHFPLLWINIRVAKRVWLSQVEGIANLINQLYADYPNIGVVFNGCCLLETDEVGASSFMIETEKLTMQQIVDLLPSDIDTYCVIGRHLYETLLWVQTVTLHLTSHGSGSLIPTLANKPGLLYGHSAFCETWAIIQYLENRENTIPPIFLPKEYLIYADDTTLNFDIDWKGIHNEVVKIINNLTFG